MMAHLATGAVSIAVRRAGSGGAALRVLALAAAASVLSAAPALGQSQASIEATATVVSVRPIADGLAAVEELSGGFDWLVDRLETPLAIVHTDRTRLADSTGTARRERVVITISFLRN